MPSYGIGDPSQGQAPIDAKFAADRERAAQQRAQQEAAYQAQRTQQQGQAAQNNDPRVQATANLTNAQAGTMKPNVAPPTGGGIQIGGGTYPMASQPVAASSGGFGGGRGDSGGMLNNNAGSPGGPPSGPAPVTQGAYEQQLQTMLEGDIGSKGQSAAATAALEQLKLQQSGSMAELSGRGANEQALQGLMGQQQQALQAGGFEGQGKLSAQEATQQGAYLGQRAQLGEGAWNARLQAIQNLPPFDAQGGTNGFQGGGGVERGLGDGSNAPGMAGGNPFSNPAAAANGATLAAGDPAEQTARDSAFAREKDKLGQIGRGSLTALQGLMQQRGMAGSGEEMAGEQNILGGVQGGLGDVAREQTIQDLQRSGQVSDRNYAGGLQKRGQDINYRQALLGLVNSGPLY